MKNTLLYLIAYPGTGKLTVAKALCAKTGARLMDNHLINNVVFSLIETDGKTPVPEPVWDEIKQVRDSALRVIARHASPECSFVLTNVLLDDAGDRSLLSQVEFTADQRGSLFVPVVLECDVEENMQRLVAPGRKEALKEIDVPSARERRLKQPLLQFTHPNRLDLDITKLTPEQAVEKIMAHVARLGSEIAVTD